MGKIRFFSVLLAVSACAAYAQEDGWYHVTTSQDGDNTYSIKLGSGERSQNRNGDPMTVVVGKNSDNKNGRINIYKWYVTDADCTQEYGNLVALKVDGTFDFETPFAIGSNNIASGIAETICSVTANENNKAAGKGI